ncbi:MAG: hypothetical protein MUC92_10860 [Fimbriimonadaceae bacterium]|jgi:hypothetical protein|nr:hypothetical protein [Fimbriimonadaceae bacterium]
MIPVFGRTNQVVPRFWYRPELGGASPDELADAISGTRQPVVDFSGNQALWGHAFRGKDVRAMTTWGLDLETANSESHASDLLGAHLIQSLSAIHRTTIDFYFLRIRRTLEEYQLIGALETLEVAKQDGLVQSICLFADGPSIAVQGVWRFHDAFEALLIRRNPTKEGEFQGLEPLAKERRVGVLVTEGHVWPDGDLRSLSRPAWASYMKHLSLSSAALIPLQAPTDIPLLESTSPLSEAEIRQEFMQSGEWIGENEKHG